MTVDGHLSNESMGVNPKSNYRWEMLPMVAPIRIVHGTQNLHCQTLTMQCLGPIRATARKRGVAALKLDSTATLLPE